MAKSMWKDIYIITAYELAKSGMTQKKIAKTLGIATITFHYWEKHKPAFKQAVKEGRKIFKGRCKNLPTFQDYVYQRLPKALRKTWDQLDILSNDKNGLEKAQSLLEDKGEDARKHLFIYAWTSGNFVISNALRKCCISRKIYEKWLRTDPDFLSLIDEIDFQKKDFFENSFIQLAMSGNPQAIIDGNKTLNKDRGYGQQTQVNMHLDDEVSVITTIKNLKKLSLGTKKELLSALREQKVN